jgi:hypothetical protein
MIMISNLNNERHEFDMDTWSDFYEMTRGVPACCCGCQGKSDVIQMIIDETLGTM